MFISDNYEGTDLLGDNRPTAIASNRLYEQLMWNAGRQQRSNAASEAAAHEAYLSAIHEAYDAELGATVQGTVDAAIDEIRSRLTWVEDVAFAMSAKELGELGLSPPSSLTRGSTA